MQPAIPRLSPEDLSEIFASMEEDEQAFRRELEQAVLVDNGETMDDGITILDEAAPSPGVREVPAPPIMVPITMAEPKKPAKTVTVKVKEPEIVEVAAPILWRGWQVKVTPAGLGLMAKIDGGAWNYLAYSSFEYALDDSKMVAAQAMLHNGRPVFAPSEREMEIFRRMLDSFDVKIAEGFVLCFSAPLDGKKMNVSTRDVVCITWTATKIYVDTHDTSFTLNIVSPLDVTMEKFFLNIKKLIARDTRQIRNELSGARVELVQLRQERAEDTFSYLSDIKPAPEHQEIHDFLLAQREEVYRQNQLRLQRLTATQAELTQKVLDATGQLPTGRKGAGTKRSYLSSPILSELLEDVHCDQSRDRMTVVFDYKKDLVLEGIRYGRPRIEMVFTSNKREGRDGTNIYRLIPYSQDYKAFLHPHIRGSENWCLGTYSPPISAAFMSGNLPLLTSLIWQYLGRYNESSPLVDIGSCRVAMASARPRDLIVRRK